MSSIRQLAWKDRAVWLLEQAVSNQWDDCSDFVEPYIFPDMETKVPLVLYLSQTEWTTLYSAVMTGADLSYPLTSHEVELLFLQTVICPMNQICAALIDCLQNDEDTWSALQTLLANNGITGGVGDPNQPMDDDVLGGNLLPAGYTCTDDKAFGMALAVVNAINDATTEVLQAIEILTNPVELAAELGDNIPGVGALSSAGDVARWIQDAAKEGYDLAWSATIRDELACLLWCEFKGDCELSFDSIWDVYLGAADVAPPSSVLLTDWLAWLILLPFTASLSTVATISLLGLLAMRYGGSFGDFQLGIRSMEMVINLAQDDSSSDWSTVCDACDDSWCHEFDFSIDDGGWYGYYEACADTTFGIYSGGKWNQVYDARSGCAGSQSFNMCWIEFAISAQITKMEITYSMDYVQAWGTGQTFAPRPGVWENIPDSTVVDNVLTWNGDVAATELKVILVPAFDGGNVGSASVSKVKIWGYGYNPWGSSNC